MFYKINLQIFCEFQSASDIMWIFIRSWLSYFRIDYFFVKGEGGIEEGIESAWLNQCWTVFRVMILVQTKQVFPVLVYFLTGAKSISILIPTICPIPFASIISDIKHFVFIFHFCINRSGTCTIIFNYIMYV